MTLLPKLFKRMPNGFVSLNPFLLALLCVKLLESTMFGTELLDLGPNWRIGDGNNSLLDLGYAASEEIDLIL